MTGERKYDVILLDVDGTLLNFCSASAQGESWHIRLHPDCLRFRE